MKFLLHREPAPLKCKALLHLMESELAAVGARRPFESVQISTTAGRETGTRANDGRGRERQTTGRIYVVFSIRLPPF